MYFLIFLSFFDGRIRIPVSTILDPTYVIRISKYKIAGYEVPYQVTSYVPYLLPVAGYPDTQLVPVNNTRSVGELKWFIFDSSSGSTIFLILAPAPALYFHLKTGGIFV